LAEELVDLEEGTQANPIAVLRGRIDQGFGAGMSEQAVGGAVSLCRKEANALDFREYLSQL
jgi:hypothetical protein